MRGGGGRRRTINEINMVPFIDVMLVLLIIFMVSAPLITPSVVDLPTVGKASRSPEKYVEVVVKNDESLQLKVNGKDEERTDLKSLATSVKRIQAGSADVPVIISADKSVRYELVVSVMDKLQRAGVQRVGLSVRQTP
jgi:biopolymer transport protein TolR